MALSKNIEYIIVLDPKVLLQHFKLKDIGQTIYDTLPDQVYISKSCVKKNDYELIKCHKVFIILSYGSLYIY